MAGGDDGMPVGVLVGPGMGRTRGIYGSSARGILSQGLQSVPRKTRGVSELRKDGGKGLRAQLGSVLGLIMKTALGENISTTRKILLWLGIQIL